MLPDGFEVAVKALLAAVEAVPEAHRISSAMVARRDDGAWIWRLYVSYSVGVPEPLIGKADQADVAERIRAAAAPGAPRIAAGEVAFSVG